MVGRGCVADLLKTVDLDYVVDLCGKAGTVNAVVVVRYTVDLGCGADQHNTVGLL